MFAFFPAKGIQAICHPSPHGLCGILMLRKRLAVAATWMGKSITCALCALRNLEPRASLAHGFPAVCRGLWFELVCDGRRGDLSRHFFDSVCVLFRGGLSRPFFCIRVFRGLRRPLKYPKAKFTRSHVPRLTVFVQAPCAGAAHS